jgi:hypothetical protein
VYFKEADIYIDPGSGSVILQVILAALLGIGVVFKMFWGKIKSLFSKKTDKEDS